MIVVRLTGGLGNQMFQYALGRRLADADGRNLWLDLSAYRTSGWRGETPRQYQLGVFNVAARVLPVLRAAVLLPFPRRLPLRLAHLPHWPGRLKVMREQGRHFDAAILAEGGDLYLDGYWQSERYFADIAAIIRQDFSLREPMSAPRRALADEVAACPSVSVHVRRGDYVTHAGAAAFHGTCPPEWYVEAFRRMAASLQSPRFYVFSDDPAWVRANLPTGYDLRFVDPQPDGRDYEDMHVMARCRHHIIANSSFSWWGAWLDPSPETRVIAPARWLAGDQSAADQLPERWLRL